MKHPKVLVVVIGQAALQIRLKGRFRDAALPKETIELLTTVVIEKMLNEVHVATNESGSCSSNR